MVSLGFSPLQQWLWVSSVTVQLAVCGFLFYRRHFRTLPLFTTYIVLNLCQAGFLSVVYAHYGFDSDRSTLLFRISEAITLVARVFATVELLQCVLGAYRGVWAMAWRLLAVTFTAILVYASYASYAALHSHTSVPEAAVVTADRGFHLAFAVALVACLLLVRYYSIGVPPVHKVLLAGFCFYSCTVVLKNTLLHTLILHFQYASPHYQRIWDAATLLPFIIVQIVWAAALRKPATAVHRQPVLLPVSVYRQVSPELNLRLRALNEQLSQFWKVEAPRP